MSLLKYHITHSDVTLGSTQADDLRFQGWTFGAVSSGNILLGDVLMKNRATAGSEDAFLGLWNIAMQPAW